MKKLIIITAVAIIAFAITLGVTACSASGITAASSQPIVSYNGTNQQQGIWVNGEGKVTANPDVATLNLSVTAQASTVAEAQSQAATAMDKVMSALTANGVSTKDIKTQNFTIQ